jgi:hypothetical protein
VPSDGCTHFRQTANNVLGFGQFSSEWKFLTGGIPQGTWFGPYSFIIMIDSLRTIIDTYKFVDDVTLTEVIIPSADSQMQLAMNQVVAWSQSNFMNIITKKQGNVVGPSYLSSINQHCYQQRHS